MVMSMMGGGQTPPQGGAPSDLASMLGMGGGAPPPDAGGGGGDPEQAYQALIDGTNDAQTLVQWAKMAITKAIGLDPDEQDKLVLEDMNSRAQKYLAAQQQTADQMGGSTVKGLRKVFGG